jgi:hypothetical protein
MKKHLALKVKGFKNGFKVYTKKNINDKDAKDILRWLINQIETRKEGEGCR